MPRVAVESPVLQANREIAAANRARFDAAGVAAINLMSAPGAGKTTLLERSLPLLARRWRIAVIEGDLKTDLDAQRIRRAGIAAHQVNTSSCHLDANMVRGAFEQLETPQVLFIENIGNLVCPAAYDLGEHLRVTVFSVAEGADKPKKYPKMFLQSAAVVLNKVDLVPYCDVDLDELTGNVRDVSPRAAVFPLSCRTGAGLEAWIEWLGAWIAARRQEV
jgi:hydrogenase nickel incorporation protein HypB